MFSLSLIMCYLTNGESTHTHTHVYKRLYLKLMALCTILIFLCGCTEFKPSGTEEYENDEMQQAMNFDAIRTKDPTTNTVPSERRIAALNTVTSYNDYVASAANPPMIAGNQQINWWEMGPKNVGGRTRTIWPDLNNTNRLWAGGVGGGLWKCYNGTAVNPIWYKVNGSFDNLAVTTIAQNPTNKSLMYFGTGEGWFNGDAIRGGGIWRSANNGLTWTNVSPTTTDYFIQKIVVGSNGTVYAATRARGVMQSTDNGISWSVIAGNGTAGIAEKSVADLELAADGTLYASFGFLEITGTAPSLSFSFNGRLWKRSTAGVWSECSTASPWPSAGARGRIELACAPNNSNILYAAIANTISTNGASINRILKSTNGGTSWTQCTLPVDADNSSNTFTNCGLPNCITTPYDGSMSTTDFTRGQAWYDLTLAVDPLNSNNIFIGGIDAFKSTDSGTNWTQISKWLSCIPCGSCNFMHADQHSIVFKPGSSSIMYFGNDGGIYRTTNANATNPSITAINDFYNTTQYYSCAIHPTAATVLGGTQDNGTTLNNTLGFSSATSFWHGDGGFAFIDQDSPDNTVVSNTGMSYSRKLISNGNCTQLTGSGLNGRFFINPADYDDNNNILYASGVTTTGTNKLAKWTNVTSSPVASSISLPVSNPNWGNRAISAITVDPNTPTTIYIGSGSTNLNDTTVPKLFKITNANGTNPIFTELINASWPSGTTISCIAVSPINSSHIVVTLSNYGELIRNIWHSTDGGATWSSLDNAALGAVSNIPDMPIRWALFDPTNADKLLVATEVGVWFTGDINGLNTVWTPANNGLVNTRVDMLQIRPSDRIIVAATHGRGLYYTDSFSDQTLSFVVDNTLYCPGNSRNFTSNTTGTPPVSFAWDLQTDGNVDVTTTHALNRTDYGHHVSLSANLPSGLVRTVTRLNYMKQDLNCPIIIDPNCCNVKKMDDLVSSVATNKVYPNPADRQVFYSGSSLAELINIYDLNGRIIKSVSDCYSGSFIDTSDIPSGYYIFQIYNNYEISSQKIFIQH